MTNTTPIKIFKEIVPNGYSVVEYEYYWHKGERIKHGWYKSCESRVMIRSGNYKHNKKDGKLVLYSDENVDGIGSGWQWRGRLNGEEHYIDGKKNDKSVHYWRNGQVSSEGNYVDDKKEGPVIGFMENGKVYWEGNFVNDKKEGRWVWYDEDGSGDIKDDDIFENGLRVGWQDDLGAK